MYKHPILATKTQKHEGTSSLNLVIMSKARWSFLQKAFADIFVSW